MKIRVKKIDDSFPCLMENENSGEIALVGRYFSETKDSYYVHILLSDYDNVGKAYKTSLDGWRRMTSKVEITLSN